MTREIRVLRTAKNTAIARALLKGIDANIAKLAGLRLSDKKAYERALDGYNRLRRCLYVQIHCPT